jgi:hypothetical protein
MARYISTKTFDNYSVAIRQWKAQHSHCQLLHGYGIYFKVWFASNQPDLDKQLDEMNWIVDFGFDGWLNGFEIDSYDVLKKIIDLFKSIKLK